MAASGAMEIDLDSDPGSQQWRGGEVMEHDIEMLCGTQAGSSQLGNVSINGKDAAGNNDVVLADTDTSGILGIDEETQSAEKVPHWQGNVESAVRLDRREERRDVIDLANYLSSSPNPCPPMTSRLLATRIYREEDAKQKEKERPNENFKRMSFSDRWKRDAHCQD